MQLRVMLICQSIPSPYKTKAHGGIQAGIKPGPLH